MLVWCLIAGYNFKALHYAIVDMGVCWMFWNQSKNEDSDYSQQHNPKNLEREPRPEKLVPSQTPKSAHASGTKQNQTQVAVDIRHDVHLVLWVKKGLGGQAAVPENWSNSMYELEVVDGLSDL